MRNYRTETSFVVDSVRCDRCGREDDDPMEMQEYLRVDFVGGFLSVFGDGNKFTGDFCQYCVKAMIGNYLTKVEEVLFYGCQRGD